MAGPSEAVGQVGADLTETTANTPDSQTGQSAETTQTTVSGPVDGEGSFFDPESIKGKPELEQAYKQMLTSYRQKTAEIAKGRDKLKQYDQFMADPLGSIRQLATQYGYQLVQGPNDEKTEKKEFNSWDDVMSEAKRQVMEELKPVIGEVQTLRKQTIEQQLDTNYPDWRTYEDSMMANLQAHPTLVNEPGKLYALSVPPEILEARATKRAMEKIQGAKDNSVIQGQSTTTRQTSESPKAPLSFSQAADLARKRLAERGLARPRD